MSTRPGEPFPGKRRAVWQRSSRGENPSVPDLDADQRQEAEHRRYYLGCAAAFTFGAKGPLRYSTVRSYPLSCRSAPLHSLPNPSSENSAPISTADASISIVIDRNRNRL